MPWSLLAGIVNDIWLYTSVDGSTAGCSQSGLARLAGVRRQSLAALIEFYRQYEDAGKCGDETLKALLQGPYYMQAVGTNNAKILKEEACVALFEYYAFLSSESGTG